MKTRKIAFTVLFALFFIPGMFGQYEIGDKVDGFKLESTEGEYISLSDYEDEEGIILVFTCNTCPFAQKYEQRIIDLDKTYAKKGYPVLAINPNCVSKKPGDSMEAMDERSIDKGYSFAYLKDNGQKVAKEFGAERTPEIYLLENRDDGFYLVYTGTIDNNVDDPSKADEHYVKNAIEDLMENKNVALAETKAIGCTIKWSE
ncbi:MAG: thioredoxin family protein [Bacteroidota bacterium]